MGHPGSLAEDWNGKAAFLSPSSFRKESEWARPSEAAWPGAKRRWLCGYPEGFFLLLEKSECRFRETGWCAQEDQWIWEVHWWHMLGFRCKWQLQRRRQQKGRKKPTVSGMPWRLHWQTEYPSQQEEVAPVPWSSKGGRDLSHRQQGVKFPAKHRKQAHLREALVEPETCRWWEMVRKGLSGALRDICKMQTKNSPNKRLTASRGERGFSRVNVCSRGSLTKLPCKPSSWIVFRCSPALCNSFVYPGLQSLQHTHPAHCQRAKALGPTLRQKGLSICYALIEWAAEDRGTRNIFVGTEEEAWRESELGTIKIARNSGAPTSRRIQGQRGKYIKYVNRNREPSTNFKEDWKIFLQVQWTF